MKYPITTTLGSAAYHFLVAQAKKQKVNRNTIIEEALKIYKKMLLKQQVEEGLKDRQEEYREMAAEFEEVQSEALLKNE